MPTLPTIPADIIKKTAGEQRFQRGLSAARDAKVLQLELSERGASGQLGSYQVSIAFQGDLLSGSCNCADSDGFDFCEHCVVLALVANRHSSQRQTLAKGSDRSKVLAYLLAQDKADLAKQILAMLDDDPAMFRDFLLRATLEHEEIDYADLRKQVTALTRPEERLFSQRQVKHFFTRVEQFLSALHRANPNEPERMLKVLDYLLQRLTTVLDQTDDRAGLRERSARLLSECHLRLFKRLEGRSSTLAKRYLHSWQLDPHGLLQYCAADYLDDAGRTACIEAFYQRWAEADTQQRRALVRSLQQMDAIDLTREHGVAMRCFRAREASDWLRIAEDLQALERHDESREVLEQAYQKFAEHDGIICALVASLLSMDQPDHQRLQHLCVTHTAVVAPLLFPFAGREAKQHDQPCDRSDEVPKDEAQKEDESRGSQYDSKAGSGGDLVLSAVQQHCFDALLKQDKVTALRWCRDIWLALGEGMRARALLLKEDAPEVEALLYCARLLQQSHHEEALALVARAFEVLLGKERYTTDRQLAGLITDFPIVCDAAQQAALVARFRQQIHRRPAILEALRQQEQTQSL